MKKYGIFSIFATHCSIQRLWCGRCCWDFAINGDDDIYGFSEDRAFNISQAPEAGVGARCIRCEQVNRKGSGFPSGNSRAYDIICATHLITAGKDKRKITLPYTVARVFDLPGFREGISGIKESAIGDGDVANISSIVAAKCC